MKNSVFPAASLRVLLLGSLPLAVALVCPAQSPTPDLPPLTDSPAGSPPGVSGDGTSPAPAFNPAAELAAAKILEEGDGEPRQALRAYLALINQHDRQRPTWAEAFLRAGEVARRIGLEGDARGFYQRVVSQFGDCPEIAQRAQERLDNLDESPDTRAANAPNLPMSPELMRRYGLTTAKRPGSQPANAANPSAPQGPNTTRYGGMSPELLRRYGLTSDPAAPAAPRSATATTQRNRYGGGDADPASAELRALRAEAVELRAQLRRVQRQLQVLGQTPISESPERVRELPLQLIEDARLLQMLEDLDRSEELAARTGNDPHAVETRARQLEATREYVNGTLAKRLQNTRDVLQQELDDLNVQIAQRQEMDKEKAEAGATTPSVHR